MDNPGATSSLRSCALTGLTTYTAFAAQAQRTPIAVAIRDEGQEFRYAALLRACRDVGRALMARNLAKGDRVGIWANNRAEWIIAALGIQAAGLVLVPLGTRLRGGEVADILVRSGAKCLFSDAGFGSHRFIDSLRSQSLPQLETIVCFDRDCQGGIYWNEFVQTPPAVTEAALDARIASVFGDDLVDILFTSGTTGMPKGVPMTHAQSLIACNVYQDDVCKLKVGDTFCVIFPFAHTAGYRGGWQVSLLNGVRVVPVRNTETQSLLTLLHTEKPSYLPAAPTVFRAFLEYSERHLYDLSSVRLASTGGTDVPAELVFRMRTALGVQAVVTGYGMTETGGSVTNSRPGDPDDVVAYTAGRRLSNLDVVCVDADLRPLPAGMPGEILIRGPQVFKGYFEDQAASKAAFTQDGFFRSGDIGKFDADGNLTITGRLKDMYIVGGFNCYPPEIERMIRTIDGVADAAVVGVPDPRLGEVGHAFIVRVPGSVVDEAAIIAWCRANMANYKVPRFLTFLADLPRNTQGKVLKAELRKQHAPS